MKYLSLISAVFFIQLLCARPAALQKAVSFAPLPMTQAQIERASSPSNPLATAASDIPEDGSVYICIFSGGEKQGLKLLCWCRVNVAASDANMAEDGGIRLVYMSRSSVSDAGNFTDFRVSVLNPKTGESAGFSENIDIPDGRFARAFAGRLKLGGVEFTAAVLRK